MAIPPINPIGAGRVTQLLPAKRRKAGLVYIEGEKLVHEALSGDWECRLLLVEDDHLHTPGGRDCIAAAQARGVEVVCTDRRTLARLTSCETAPPVGVVLAPPDLSIENVTELPKRLLILDRLSDPGNAGTLARSAAAFGFVPVLTLNGVRPTNEKFLRSSAGLCFGPGRILTGGEPGRLAAFLHERNVATVLLDPYAPGFLEDFSHDSAAALALVLGNESTGVDRQLWRWATPLRIQMSPLVESLNVAMAGAIALHHFRHRGGGR
ncbi:MAG: RNA methyltransferase [Candidatus Sumerlaeia bacterium]|nr:RNA methyltransferase [Candidatus Sumerlaeia bacterium]